MNELYRCCQPTSIMVIANNTEKNSIVLTFMHKTVNKKAEYANNRRLHSLYTRSMLKKYTK